MTRLFRRTSDVPKRSLWQRIKDIALTDVTVVARPGGMRAVEASLEQLEEILLDADFGVSTTLRMVADMERLAQRGEVRTEEEYLHALKTGVEQALNSGNSDPALVFAPNAPTVIVVIGVNGAGKTTFIGKLAARLMRDGKRVLLAAGDTFRAGAIDQLRLWAERVGADFVGGQPGGDAAAVAFDAIDAAVSRQIDVVIVDTAGRLHTSANLMDELKKVVRVIQKRLPDAPHETLLVLDGTIGQNAVAQAKTFSAAVPVTGLVVTKVDGTAKGGIVIAVHEAIDVPVKFIGVGEKVGDLERFNASEFATELLAS
ncbi:MAG TPA: signal recognition particle-docking protein FtsY [Gemmatimonadaceae bacterium]|nr:signal recognition particle-docking protein FtsY [Gemmatimonadaceae bacterium]